MSCRALVTALCLTVPTAGSAQTTSSAPSLAGVWKIVEVVRTGANPASISNPQPSLVIFTKGHYSYLSVTGDQPRPQFARPKDPNKMTDAEKIARYEQWSPFIANAGTYEVRGTKLILRPVVAKSETVMARNSTIESEFTLEGDTLRASTRSPAGQPASETRFKLRRVE